MKKKSCSSTKVKRERSLELLYASLERQCLLTWRSWCDLIRISCPYVYIYICTVGGASPGHVGRRWSQSLPTCSPDLAATLAVLSRGVTRGLPGLRCEGHYTAITMARVTLTHREERWGSAPDMDQHLTRQGTRRQRVVTRVQELNLQKYCQLSKQEGQNWHPTKLLLPYNS